jgi:hypothetical protein
VSEPSYGLLLNVAIQKLCPGAEYTMTNDDYETIEWVKIDTAAPSSDEIKKAVEEAKIRFKVEQNNRNTARQALLDRLGITEEEAKLLLGGN